MILKILKLLILKMKNEILPLILFNCNTTTTITKFLALGGCVTNRYNYTFSPILALDRTFKTLCKCMAVF